MTFEPTEEQFQEPLKYLEEIFALGHHYGIVKIIPPDSWRRNTGLFLRYWVSFPPILALFCKNADSRPRKTAQATPLSEMLGTH